jgi:fatty acid desaturase
LPGSTILVLRGGWFERTALWAPALRAAQRRLTAVGIMWAVSMKSVQGSPPVALCGQGRADQHGIASLAAHYVALQFAPLWGLLLGGMASVVVFFALFYLFRVLEVEDRSRFESLTRMLPGPLGKTGSKVLSILIPAAEADVNPANV